MCQGRERKEGRKTKVDDSVKEDLGERHKTCQKHWKRSQL